MANLNELKPTTQLTPFGKFCCTIGNIPSSYMASLTYEEQLLWFCNYLQNTVIPAVNTNAEAVVELQNLYIELKNYVDNYFTNLDVQTEINNKLDEMAEDGTLTNLIGNYVNPFFEEQNQKILNFENTTNTQINNIKNYVNEISQNYPTFVNSVEDMTDENKLYVLSSNGHIYYYDGLSFIDSNYVYGNSLAYNSVNPINMNSNFNDNFFALPFLNVATIKKGGQAVNNHYPNMISRPNFNTLNGISGSLNYSYIYAEISDIFAPKYINGKLDKIIDIVTNITSDKNYDVLLSSSPDWSSNFYALNNISSGINYLRLNDGILTGNPDNDTIFKYIIIRIQNVNNEEFSGSLSAYIQNDAIFELNKNIKNFTPNFLNRNNFNDNFIACPFEEYGARNKNGNFNITSYPDYINRVFFDTNEATEGTFNQSYIYVKIPDNLAPIYNNGKLDKPISIIANIETDMATLEYADIVLASRNDWGEYALISQHLNNGINLITIDGTEQSTVSIPDDTKLEYLMIRAIRGNAEIKGSISCYFQNDLIKFTNDISNLINNATKINYNFIGDSLTALNYSRFINRNNIRNFAVGGENIEQIYNRTGITPLFVLDDLLRNGKNQINLSDNSLFKQGMGNINPVSINNILGNLSRENDIIYFTPNDTIEETKIFKPTVIPNNVNYKGVVILWAGTNSLNDLSSNEIFEKWKEAFNIFDNMLIIGLTNDRTYLTKINELNSLSSNYFGSRFINVHDWLVSYGLQYLDIEPTEQDNTDIENNLIPTSLLQDGLHFNENGQKCIAHLVEERLNALNL